MRAAPDRRSAAERQTAALAVLRETRRPRILALAEASGDDELIRDVVAAYVVAAVKRRSRGQWDAALVEAAGVFPTTVWRWGWLANGQETFDLMRRAMAEYHLKPPSDLDVRRRRLVRMWASGSPDPQDPEPARGFDPRAIAGRVRAADGRPSIQGEL